MLLFVIKTCGFNHLFVYRQTSCSDQTYLVFMLATNMSLSLKVMMLFNSLVKLNILNVLKVKTREYKRFVAQVFHHLNVLMLSNLISVVIKTWPRLCYKAT